jgi:hypothetical protein
MTRCRTNPASRATGPHGRRWTRSSRCARTGWPTVRRVTPDLTDEKLAGLTEPVSEPGYPEQQSFAVRRCLQAILNEEWQHRLYAERDFDVIESRFPDG